MSVAAESMPDWSEWEGECADGRFFLDTYLGGSQRSAVFRTRFGSERAAIKLVRTTRSQADDLLKGWSRAATLMHPHLLPTFAVGTCVVAGFRMPYLVMECADDDLAAVLGERSLTPGETLETIRPIADVLEYLHGAGLAHGNLKPSNVLAVGDTLKVSCETACAGDPAADVWGLSKMMIQALTQWNGTAQGRPDRSSVETLPQPLQEIARRCFFAEPRDRWSSADVAKWLRTGRFGSLIRDEPDAYVSDAGATKRRFGFLAVLTLVVVAIVIGVLVSRRAGPPAASTKTTQPIDTPAKAANSIPVAPVPDDDRQVPGAIVHRVLPDIPAKARKTIRGRATVAVKVAVNASGSVRDAKLERGGSPYFGKLALAAARQWQFASMDGAARREWVLKFEITKTAIQVIPVEQSGH